MTDVYGTAYKTIRAGAPGLSDATCGVIAQTIARKLQASAPNLADKSKSELAPTPIPIATAPRDGKMLRLWVRYPEGGSWTPLVDARESWTIGFNNRDNTEDDRWQVAGWCWSHDHLVEAADDVEVLGWLPFHSEATGNANVGRTWAEKFIADEEDGPVAGICIDLPDGSQIWSGECSNALLEQAAALDQSPDESGQFLMIATKGQATRVVAQVATVDDGIALARAAALSRALVSVPAPTQDASVEEAQG